jgi:hypothetical protein
MRLIELVPDTDTVLELPREEPAPYNSGCRSATVPPAMRRVAWVRSNAQYWQHGIGWIMRGISTRRTN